MIVISPVVLCSCETWAVILKEQTNMVKLT
jgi:hypothetical protein